MSLNCASCGTELLPATSFCRQCGAAVSQSEQPTALFSTDPGLKTQRLESRTTGEPTVFPATELSSSHQPRQTLRWSIVAAILSVLLICVIGGAFLVIMRGKDQTIPIYPGAKTIVDLKYGDGSRALQLETDDNLSKVETWYAANLKLDKTMRLTEASVVLKSENKTITLVSEDNKTNILIKMAP